MSHGGVVLEGGGLVGVKIAEKGERAKWGKGRCFWAMWGGEEGETLWGTSLHTPYGVEGMWMAGAQVGGLARLRRRDDVGSVCTTGGCGGGGETFQATFLHTPGGVEGMWAAGVQVGVSTPYGVEG